MGTTKGLMGVPAKGSKGCCELPTTLILEDEGAVRSLSPCRKMSNPATTPCAVCHVLSKQRPSYLSFVTGQKAFSNAK